MLEGGAALKCAEFQPGSATYRAVGEALHLIAVDVERELTALKLQSQREVWRKWLRERADSADLVRFSLLVQLKQLVLDQLRGIVPRAQHDVVAGDVITAAAAAVAEALAKAQRHAARSACDEYRQE